MLSVTLLSFIFFTGLVIALTWWFTRGSDLNTDEATSLVEANRHFHGPHFADEPVDEQLIGLNAGSSARDCLSCWK